MKKTVRQQESESMENSKMKNAASKARSKSLLESFEYIVELAQNSGLDAEFFEKAGRHIRFASRRLKLTPMQVTLLALFVDRSQDSHIYPSEIAEYTGCRTTRILRLSEDIDELERQHYLRAARSRNSLSYRVPHDVLYALRNNTPYVYVDEPVKDTQTFFDRFSSLMEEKNSDELTHKALMACTIEKLDEIKDSVFATELSRNGLENEDLLLFIYMAHLYVENNDDMIGFHDIARIYDDDELPMWCKHSLRSRQSVLFRRNLIENVNEDGLARADSFKLTDFAKENILVELGLNQIGKSDKDLIKAESLTEKRLVYNTEENKQISELSSILTEKRFADVQTRLRDAGMRQGFCCLFYGAPGTGKTETVYQLARLTGRDILRVDVDKIKNCWVGESEKNIKSLFTRYRNICKNTKLAPILLFNEADAVLGIRMEGASTAVDKMENSIQNIILQEMESLEGIMIATTNLTTNLDKAFERRFLYKIRFEKPSLEARTRIWMDMLYGLSETDAHTLASKFDLSGGEIENIVRKHTVGAILSGKDLIDMNQLISICNHERLTERSTPRIGF